MDKKEDNCGAGVVWEFWGDAMILNTTVREMYECESQKRDSGWSITLIRLNTFETLHDCFF